MKSERIKRIFRNNKLYKEIYESTTDSHLEIEYDTFGSVIKRYEVYNMSGDVSNVIENNYIERNNDGKPVRIVHNFKEYCGDDTLTTIYVYGYNINGNLLYTGSNNNIDHEYEYDYDNAGKITSMRSYLNMKNNLSNTVDRVLESITEYSYYDNGKLKCEFKKPSYNEKYPLITGFPNEVKRYFYDDRCNLIAIRTEYQSINTILYERWNYDENGNMDMHSNEYCIDILIYDNFGNPIIVKEIYKNTEEVHTILYENIYE